MARPAPSSLDALRAHLRAVERPHAADAATLPLFPAIDVRLPGGGLALGCLHQIIGEADGAATALAALIAGRLAERLDRPILWLPRGGDLHPPGLAAWSLPSRRLLIAEARSDSDRLWAMEEALRCPDLAGVVGELADLALTAGRRLQLAAEAGGTTGLALHPSATHAANAGTTRWRVSNRPGGRWLLNLERCRGGLPGEWEIRP